MIPRLLVYTQIALHLMANVGGERPRLRRSSLGSLSPATHSNSAGVGGDKRCEDWASRIQHHIFKDVNVVEIADVGIPTVPRLVHDLHDPSPRRGP